MTQGTDCGTIDTSGGTRLSPNPKPTVTNPFGGYRPAGVGWKVNLLAILFITSLLTSFKIRISRSQTAAAPAVGS